MCVPSCADAAVLPVGSCEADSSKAQGIPAEMEMVASSQGSPIINPLARMLLLPQTDNPDGLGVDVEACASVTTTPASSMVTGASCCCLLSSLFAGVFWLPVRPIIVNEISQRHIERISTNLAPMSTWTQR